ncbi:MAG TPA: nitronate monooxygenase [Acidimicrobiales bacterium]|nr:nitronate monooxygenase [Acidimicrobiales bacterium]
METPFTRLVGCRVPIQQAGMGATSSVELAAAVAGAGALGMLGTAGLPPESVVPALDLLAARTDGVFGANFPGPFLDRDAVSAAASRARVVEFFYGDPDAELVHMVHDAGALASWQVGSVDEARAAAGAGCDLVVAQGTEAGGHVRGRVALLPLLDAVLDAVDVPVVAAGGIGSARSLAAVLAAGAAGARLGTLFLAASEADVHPTYRDALIAAGPEDTELTTTFSTWWDAPHRVLRDCITEALAGQDEVVGEVGLAGGRRLAIPRLCVLHPVQATTGRIEAMALYAGQSVGYVRQVRPAADIVAELAAGAEELLGQRLPQ